jgi:6-pyruvoyltetrahydropterin/6-carboxytetrahydropterin synthase
MGESSIWVDHNMEIAHRLTQLPGKCERIHGHSLQVRLTLTGQVSHSGVMADLDFGRVKEVFRGHLDETYDHHLILNENDPWATPLVRFEDARETPYTGEPLPGLVTVKGDPTIENLAKWVCSEMATQFPTPVIYMFTVRIRETNSNGATYGYRRTRGFAS